MTDSRNQPARKPTQLRVERGDYSARPVELIGPTPAPAEPPRLITSGPLLRLSDPNVRHLLCELVALLDALTASADRRSYPRRSRLEREAS